MVERNLIGRIFYLACFAVALALSAPVRAADVPSAPFRTFQDCATCPELVTVPRGSFIMGSTDGVRKKEQPAHRVTISHRFALGRYEVTFDEWDACYADGGCSNPAFDRDWGRGKLPVINVTYADTQEYFAWISRKTGETYRLPSEAEWEYAARAGARTGYWWGDKMIDGWANCRGCGTEWSGVKTAPVGSFQPSPWGLYDMHGNVLEFVADCWHDSHVGAPEDGTARADGPCTSKVVKGGAWYYLSNLSRAATRFRNDNRVYSYFIGFRVLREIK